MAMVMWDTVKRRVVRLATGERHQDVQSLGAMPFAEVDSFVYTGPLRTSRDLVIRRARTGWVVDFDYRQANEAGTWHWNHGHVEGTWLADCLAQAGEIALCGADYSYDWSRAAVA